MARTDQETRLLLLRLISEARNRPVIHRLRILGVIAVGYLWPVFVLLPTVALIVTLLFFMRVALSSNVIEVIGVYIIFLAGSIVLLGAQLRAFIVEEPVSPHLEVDRERCPELFAVIDEVRRKMGIRGHFRVHLMPFFNAAISESSGSVLPFLGRREARLLVGTPMLLCLTEADFRTVLAHEFAHLHGKHCRFGAWVSRVFRTLENVGRNENGKQGFLTRISSLYVKWYLPFYNVRTLPLRRLHEIEADVVASRIEGCEQTARAFLRTQWVGRRIAHHALPSLFRQTVDRETPPTDFLARLTAFLESLPDRAEFGQWIKTQQHVRSEIDEEHLCIVERLEALGMPGALQDARFADLDAVDFPRNDRDRSIRLLGAARSEIVGQVDQVWRATVMEEWRRARSYAQYLEKRIEEVRDKRRDDVVPGDENDYEWLLLDLEIQGLEREGMVERLTDFLQSHPRHAAAALRLGAILLAHGDGRGIEWTEKAIAWDEKTAGEGLQEILAFHRSNGDDKAADIVRKRIEAHDRLLEGALKERTDLRDTERLATHDLDDDTLRAIRNRLVLYPRIKEVWVAKREVETLASEKHYLVIVDFFRSGWSESGSRRKAMAAALQQALPVSCTVSIRSKTPKKVWNRVKAVSDGPVYSAT